jgi:hypothetical protein
MSLHEIVRRLHLSRNTVRAILKQKGEMPLGPRQDKIRIDEELLRRLYADCKGWMERMHEKLVEEEGLAVSYSTVCRRVHELGLGQGREQQRCDRVPDVAGAEMQHDTSPYQVQLGSTTTLLIADPVVVLAQGNIAVLVDTPIQSAFEIWLPKVGLVTKDFPRQLANLTDSTVLLSRRHHKCSRKILYATETARSSALSPVATAAAHLMSSATSTTKSSGAPATGSRRPATGAGIWSPLTRAIWVF